MSRSLRSVGMRWWLAAAFAAVAALTSVAVVAVLSARSASAFHRWAHDVALGVTASAAEELKSDRTIPALQRDATRIAGRRSVSIFVLGEQGTLLTSATSRGISWERVPGAGAATRAALGGSRYIAGTTDGTAFVVALQIHGGRGAAVVVFALRPELRTQLGIVRSEFPSAAIVAFLIAAAAGLTIAVLIGRRLGRIADAARAIGSGDLSRTVVDRFPDEVGSLATSIDEMRRQLAASFDTLRADRARLEELLDRLNDGVLLVDRDLRVQYANGVGEALIEGRRDLEGPEMRYLADLARSSFDGALTARVRLSLPDGRRLRLSAIPPNAADGDAILLVVDESQQERQEQAQREFATNAAHELRTPLASIVTAVEMLQTGAKDDPDVRDEFLELIAAEAGRLTRLTRALLALARASAHEEEPRLDEFAVRPILEQVASTLRPSPHVDVRIACDDDLVAHGDPILLEQAVASLAANAAQHTGRGSITLGGARAAGDVVISVADTGSGIPRDAQAKVFERFYRAATDTAGFGLGLSIARDVVQLLGGRIDVSSEPGAGTVVEIRLPVAAPAEVVA